MKYGVVGLVVAAACHGALAPAGHHIVPAAFDLSQDQSWTWHGRLERGKTLEIRGVNGSISAQPASGAEAEVVATKHARHSDPDEVRIEVVEHQGGVTICAVYPGRNNRCGPDGGTMNTHDNDVQVDFEVRVPRGVAFQGHNVNGSAEAAGLDGPVSLATVNGGVRLETSAGDAEAETVNGSITATVLGSGSGSLRFHTVNGGITLALPAGLGAELDARTVNGSIESDFPITVSGRMNPRRLSGRIGQGGRILSVETVNGSIRLRTAP